MLQEGGRITPAEMARTFNCGIGIAAIVDSAKADHVAAALETAGETVFEIGRVEGGKRGCTVEGEANTWASPEDWSATHHA